MDSTSSPIASNEPLLSIAIFAAFADGEKCDAERAALDQLGSELGADNLAALTRQILMRKVSLADAVGQLQTKEDRLLAYEMALGICESAGGLTSDEQGFLSELRGLLGLDQGTVTETERQIAAVTEAPLEAAGTAVLPEVADNDQMILKYAILNGALELLPETLATVAIVPLQMKMVYRIGKSHGTDLDKGHIKDFLATAGIGMGSQVIEGFARKIFKGFGKQLGGKLGGRAADQLAGSAFSFGTTYGLGHLADRYYADGRRLDGPAMKSIFDTFKNQAGELHSKYLPEIQERAKTLNAGSIASLVGGSATL